MTIAPPIEETDLVRLAQSGDRAAFQALYETYLPRIHDFVLGMLRNRSDAEDATSETFLRAVERLGDLREPAAFKGWLYTIARNAALRVVDARKKATPVAEHLEGATTVESPGLPQPEDAAERSELRALFDDAAATLSERDRTVFELTLRHGLGSAEVAKVLKVRPAYAYILVNRLKASVTDALEAVVLARVGRGECADLDELVSRFGTEVSPRMRKAVSRHARGCSACAGTKRRRAALPVLLEGVAFAEPSATFAAQLASSIDALWAARPPQGPTDGDAGLRGHLAGAAVAVIVLAGALVGFGAQRTITPVEEGPISPVAEHLDAPPLPAVAPEEAEEPQAPQVAPRRRVTPQVAEQPPAPPARGGGNTNVTVDNGTSGTSTDSGGSSVNNNSDMTVQTGSTGANQPDQPPPSP